MDAANFLPSFLSFAMLKYANNEYQYFKQAVINSKKIVTITWTSLKSNSDNFAIRNEDNYILTGVLQVFLNIWVCTGWL